MTDRKPLPEFSILNSLFSYDPETGDLIRKTTTSSNAKAGDVVLGLCKKGYRRVRILGENHYAHRIAWKIFYKKEPPQFLDHINQDKSDNRIKNLRKADASLNGINRKLQSNNTTGYAGVFKSRNKWRSTIRVNGSVINLGFFNDIEMAKKARGDAEKIYCNN